ncbi:MAG TPA: phosphotransferase [Acidimicrobiia bacterium]|nr:phosphotransferase [Acidimicrobiia bacterium]
MTIEPSEVAAALARVGLLVTQDPRHVARGWESNIYRCETADGVLAVRVHAGTERATAEREAAMMSTLAELDYPVPGVHGLTTVRGHPALIMAFVDGTNLWAGLHGVMESAQMCRELMNRLHRLAAPSADDSLAWLRAATDRVVHAMPRFVPFVDALWDDPPADLRVSYCHLDFHPGNVLWDGQPWVVDWTSGRITDPRLDLAWSRLLAAMHYPHAATVFSAADEDPWFDTAMALRRITTVANMLGGSAHAVGDSLADELGDIAVAGEWLEAGTGVEVRDVWALLTGE